MPLWRGLNHPKRDKCRYSMIPCIILYFPHFIDAKQYLQVCLAFFASFFNWNAYTRDDMLISDGKHNVH